MVMLSMTETLTVSKVILHIPLVITGEHENDYVHFTIAALSWQSKTPNGGASCKFGGWDRKDGSMCLLFDLHLYT